MEALATDGSHSTFATIFKRHFPRVTRYMKRYACGAYSHLYEDMTQEVFIRLMEKRATYKVGEKFLPWFYTLMSSVALNCIDGERRFQSGRESDDSLLACAGEMPELSEDLKEGLRKLDPQTRTLVERAFYDRVPLIELAAEAGVNYKTFHRKFSAVLVGLREKISA
ncbi:RNA polymerase sigma factor [Planctomicrobium sp. SH661]|uniref:RNA polymerase sigma factor n=1 Tax=Planctomicrobium sp. SH661 TaxID=3448124 RepID=UPI003F5B9F1E